MGEGAEVFVRGACGSEAVAGVYEVAEEMEFIAAGSHSEYVGIFKCCGKGEKT